MAPTHVALLADQIDEESDDTTPVPPASASKRIDPASRQRSRDALAQAMTHADVTALLAADDLYGDDIDRAMKDLKAGSHPLQSGGRGLAADEKIASELAAIRAQLEG